MTACGTRAASGCFVIWWRSPSDRPPDCSPSNQSAKIATIAPLDVGVRHWNCVPGNPQGPCHFWPSFLSAIPVRRHTMRCRFHATLALLLIATVAPAQTPKALDLVPDESLGFIIVKDLRQLSDKVEQ